MELNGGLIGIGFSDKEHAPVYGAVRAQARRQQPIAAVSYQCTASVLPHRGIPFTPARRSDGKHLVLQC